MKMTATEFDQRLTQYVQTVLIPDCKAPLRKFALGALVGTGKLSIGVLPKELVETLGIVDENGAVDIDVLKKALYGGVETAGELYISLLGLHFAKQDFDKFFGYIEKGVLG